MIVVGAMVCAAAMSSAQLNWETPSNIAARGGVVFPFDENTREAMADTPIGVGFEVFLDRPFFSDAGEASLTFDWFARGLNGDKGNITMLALNQRFYSTDPAVTPIGERSYYFVGVGMAFINVLGDTTEESFAGRIGAGKELGLHMYAEAAVTVTEDTSAGNGTSAGIYLGYRF